VNPTAIGRMVDVHADLARVTVRHGGMIVAEHDRVMGSSHVVTDPAHVAAAAAMRTQFQTPAPVEAADGLERDLADYDTAFGVSFPVEGEVA
jgi:hypothetical protein